MKIKTGFHACPSLSSPEAEPEAKAYVLLLIKEYNPREVGARGRGPRQEKRQPDVRAADISIAEARLLRGAANRRSRQPVPGGKKGASAGAISH